MRYFFFEIVRKINEGFPTLFDSASADPDEDSGRERPGRFTEIFGWIGAAERIAEYERIKLDDVWELPVIQFLNGLVYLKEKQKHVDALNKQSAGVSKAR